MFGISYGELFLLIGATATLVGAHKLSLSRKVTWFDVLWVAGPRDFPRIARGAGRLAGRSIRYVHLARGQFDNAMQQSQAHQVHKELQDALAQLESIRYEVRSMSLMNPGPMTRKLMDNPQFLTPPEYRHFSREGEGGREVNKFRNEGSDLVLEAVVEAEVACNAKEFFSQPENQIQGTEK
ncbi:uncharacterized protein LOC103941103 [Pyrus x bretschneideri]|uniref:uncharacterized protein LOC103941103 n=1 Tax=Pyrus x bretschneideri TaxID=225117 RepID=UPI002030E2D4|nr:uncharacterized protein LOC103941103 [Pyrus x bretschneideri]